MATPPSPIGTISAAIANLRGGPGTEHAVVAQASQGMSLTIVGRNAAGDWWQVCCVNNVTGWVYGNLLVIEGSTANVPVVAGAVVATAQPPPQPSIQGWRGEYFANRNLQGAAAFVRDDAEINFRWGGTAPGPGLSGVNFSVRWTRTLDFAAGNYTFSATVDDGVRVYLDGWLVIDHWQIGAAQTYTGRFDGVGAGAHTLKVEYFQAEGDAAAIFRYERASEPGQWLGEYFAGTSLEGAPLLARNEPELRFNWGLDSPDPRLPAGNWCARWTRRANFDAGNYTFQAQTTGGIRVYLDGWRLIDQWHEAPEAPAYTGRFEGVGAGEHTVMVEYFARGPALASVWWQRD